MGYPPTEPLYPHLPEIEPHHSVVRYLLEYIQVLPNPHFDALDHPRSSLRSSFSWSPLKLV
jgi:hypothetical protein